MEHKKLGIWWGAPKKFSTKFSERKISWLELLYDLVYVVAISKITQYFSQHTDLNGFLDYIYMFIMIFWGWFNGSMYHDMHGTPGIRTRLMTLWQMVAVAIMVVCLNSPPDRILFRGTIAIMIMQLYITYLWWSVGIYDKEHRRLNVPYTTCYLLSLLILFSTLFMQPPFNRVAFFVSLFLNFLPSFYTAFGLQGRSFSLSSSMAERLGLFAIIMFGEVVTGVISGASSIKDLNISGWVTFVLGILIVFALWWIFFALIADRECKEGFLKGQLMIMSYIPALMSLGMLSAAFTGIFGTGQNNIANAHLLYELFALRVAVFLFGTVLISNFLVYPDSYTPAKKWMQFLLLVIGGLVLIITWMLQTISLLSFFTILFTLLLIIIITITKAWLKFENTALE